jgi:arylsulfatase A-like enzyme
LQGLAALLLLPLLPVLSGAASRPPNVVLIVADTLRRDALSCYAGGAGTPRLDALAARGVLFEQAVSAGADTPTSVASLMTGFYPSVHGVRLNYPDVSRRSALPASFVTLAEALSRRGYDTAAFAAFDFGAFGLGQGFRRAEYMADDGAKVAGAAADFLSSRSGDGPFLLFVHLFDAHHPYAPPERLMRYAGGFPPPSAEEVARLLDAGPPADEASTLRLFAARMTGRYRPADEDRLLAAFRSEPFRAAVRDAARRDPDAEWIRFVRAAYQGEAAAIDDHLGGLFDRLESLGLMRDALVVFLSDHGELFGEGGLFQHSYNCAEDLIRVPLIVKLPGDARAGLRHAGQVRSVDVFATVLEAAGASAAGRQGESLLRALDGGKARPAFTEAHRETSVRLPPHKLVARHAEGAEPADGETTLYDVSAGEKELDDPAKRRDLTARLAGFRRDSARLRKKWLGGAAEPETPMDPALRERLRQLDYLK